MPSIVNIVICYSNEEEVLSYAVSLGQQKCSKSVVLIIVINKEGLLGYDGLLKQLKNIKLNTLVYKANGNIGYMNGLLYGYRRFIDENDNVPDWVVFSNTDIIYTHSDFYDIFLSNEYDEDIYVIAPSVYLPSRRSYSNPHLKKRFTRKDLNRRISIFERPLLGNIYKLLYFIKDRTIRHKKKDSQYVYSAHGCFFIVRGAFAEILKHKNHQVLLFSEELFIAENVIACDKLCYYDNSIEVIHNANSTIKYLGNRKRTKLLRESLISVRDTYF